MNDFLFFTINNTKYIMYLSKLDIVGFKSFAQKTSLKFTKGISAIVGPNGCGKSNIVDAIRWVLGEQKTSVLRSDVMENVIFNGTKHRKPTSMAEVSLTIENNKNILPVEYQEVVVTRRLFRSGESEYLLNNVKCRLRDVIDLFMDTGLASDSYSVIELKMVEAILSGRGDDRRALFEEAAGIKKYKIQRRDANKRLNDVSQDLTRVNDLVDEVRKNVASLQRHAQKTRRYNVLNGEYRENETKLLAFQYNEFKQKSEIYDSEIKLINQDKIKNEIELSDINLHLSKLKSDFNKVDEELKQQQNNELLLNNELASQKQTLAVSEEKLVKIDSDEGRLANEIQESNNKLENTKNYIEQNKKNIDELQNTVSGNEENLKAIETDKEQNQQETNVARNEVSQIKQKLTTLQSNNNTCKLNISNNNSKISNFQKKIDNENQEKEKIQSDINAKDKELLGTNEKQKDFTETLASLEKTLTKEKERQEKLQTELDTIRHQANEARNTLSNKKSSLSFFENLVDTSQTATFLINNKSWNTKKQILMLSEAIAVDEKFRSAIPVIISNNSDYFIVETKEEAEKAIQLLKQNKKGKSGFICLELTPNIPPPDKNIDGSLGYFSEIVRADDRLRNVLRLLFQGLIVTENSDNLDKLFAHKEVNAIVTLSGEYYHKSGAIRGGSISEGEIERIGKKEKIEKLQKEISDIEDELEKIEGNRNKLNNELQSIDIQSITNQIRQLETDKRNFENQISQIKLNKQKLQNHYELIDKNIENYNNEIAELQKENQLNQKQSEGIEISISKTSTLLDEKNNILEEVEKKQNSLDVKVREFDIQLIKSQEELKTYKNEQDRLQRQLQNYSNTIENRKIELIQNKKSREDLKIIISQTTEDFNKNNVELEKLRSNCEFLADKKKNVQEQVEQAEASVNLCRKNYDKIIENLHQKEIKFNEVNTWLQHVIENAKNNYQLDIVENTVEIPEDFSEDETKQTLQTLKQKLNNLGNINFAAIEDFEKENERLIFLENQIADLMSSEKTLRETIEEINQIAESNFIKTFNQIRVNFQNLFKKLFNEAGEADIKFDINDPLESEINIIAKPPNKRPNSIEQLSGGEKTLTAIALLFAIYLVKPSPFCILDEIDAPLDDANVARFLKLIRDFSNDTQFLIVTHNKTTMSAADTLYGVTMQEPGVSKITAVKLDIK